MKRPAIDELLERSRAGVARPGPGEALRAVETGAWLIDIRSDSQRSADGVVPGARFIPRNVLEWRLDPDSPYRLDGGPGRDDEVILMCNEGYASSLAAATLREIGLTRATDLDGGFQAWRAAGLPVARQRE